MSKSAALQKFASGNCPYGVAALYVGESGSPGLDGVEWLLDITDGRVTGEVRVRLSGSQGGARRMVGTRLEAQSVEAAAEALAGNFPVEARLPCMLAVCETDGYLALTGDDLRHVRTQGDSPNAFT